MLSGNVSFAGNVSVSGNSCSTRALQGLQEAYFRLTTILPCECFWPSWLTWLIDLTDLIDLVDWPGWPTTWPSWLPWLTTLFCLSQLPAAGDVLWSVRALLRGGPGSGTPVHPLYTPVYTPAEHLYPAGYTQHVRAGRHKGPRTAKGLSPNQCKRGPSEKRPAKSISKVKFLITSLCQIQCGNQLVSPIVISGLLAPGGFRNPLVVRRWRFIRSGRGRPTSMSRDLDTGIRHPVSVIRYPLSFSDRPLLNAV